MPTANRHSDVTRFFADRQNRRWVLLVLIVILCFLLLAWTVWLYFSVRLHQVEGKRALPLTALLFR